MKRCFALCAAVLVLALALTGCGSGGRSYDMPQLAKEMLDSDAFSDILSPVDISIGSVVYGLDSADVEDYVLYLSTRATTEEIGMFKCKDAAAAQRVLAIVQARAQAQSELYASYAPAEPPKIDAGYIKADGVYVFYIISANADSINEIMK